MHLAEKGPHQGELAGVACATAGTERRKGEENGTKAQKAREQQLRRRGKTLGVDDAHFVDLAVRFSLIVAQVALHPDGALQVAVAGPEHVLVAELGLAHCPKAHST